ncbi:MAG: glycosyltransferase involved in cell wall biosynthesis [Paraglaciecola sp.]|jgi:glycosyltransferase involved in cell wall biosynthesis
MIKVGLYLENRSIHDVDLRHPEKGNPGVGGTEYNFVNMPFNFMRFFPGDVEFVFFANSVKHLPKNFLVFQADGFVSALQLAEENLCEILIWRPTLKEEVYGHLKAIEVSAMSVIGWIHNTPEIKVLDAMANISNFKRFVAVSHEQIDLIRDHPIIYKTSLIVNGFDVETIPVAKKIKKDGDMVVYLGSLVKAKGFGLLAEVWPVILGRVPTAQLYVIGNGAVYNRGAVLGKWGVAEESFEADSIRCNLSDAHGRVHSSVHFLGGLGSEKNEYLLKASVGVVNPSGLTENCPGSAIEFQASETPVVSVAKNGLLDTVVHNKTGLLGLSKDDLVENIVYLLNTPSAVKELGSKGRQFVLDKFSYQQVSALWLDVFKEIVEERRGAFVPMKENVFYKRKWCRELIRLTKAHLYSSSYGAELPIQSKISAEDEVFLESLSDFISDVQSAADK